MVCIAGVYSVEPSHVMPTIAKPEEESVNRPTSPPVPNVPPINIPPLASSGPPQPQGHVPSSVPAGTPITKPQAESSGEETTINTNSSGPSYQPYSGGSSSSSTIPPSIQNVISSSSSSSSSSGTSTAPTSSVMCSEMSSNQSAGTSPSTNNSSCGASTGISNSSFGVTGTSNNSSYGGALTGTNYGGASTGTNYGASTGTNPNIINNEPPVADKSEMKQSPHYGGQGYLGGDDNDFQQEASGE